MAPGAWADPDARGEGKTVFIDPRNVRQMLESGDRGGTPAGQVSVPTLCVVSGALAGGRFELRSPRGESSEWTIGSNDDRNIVLSGDGVSGEHARIANEGERWKIIDQLSRYGTFVNGRRTSNSFLSSGDKVAFGPAVTCVFQLPGGAGSARRSRPAQSGAAPQKQARRGVDVATLIVSFLATAAVLLILWRFLPVLQAHFAQ
jgi:hypothetical protein